MRCFSRNVKCSAVTSWDCRRYEDRGGLDSPRTATACSVAEKTGAVVGLDNMG